MRSTVNRVSVAGWTSEEIDDGLLGMLKALQGAELSEMVRLDDTDQLDPQYEHQWSYYGSGSIQNITEAGLLKDGRVLACITRKAFLGTFASHDDVRVGWFILTPPDA
jgi:hypothetical protein